MSTINPAAIELAPHRVAAPAGMRQPRTRNAAKRCYRLAGRFVSEYPTATLVHGIVDGWIMHAWAEIGDKVVYDGTCKGFFACDGYYTVMRAVAVRRFTCEELSKGLPSGVWMACAELEAAIALLRENLGSSVDDE